MAEETQFTLGKLQASVDGIKELLLSRLNGLEARVVIIETKYAEKEQVTKLEARVSGLEQLVWKALGGGIILGFLLPYVVSWAMSLKKI